MCKFKQVDITYSCTNNLYYLPKIKECYEKYSKYFQDDFLNLGFFKFINNVAPYLWAITNDQNEFMGFVSLDNFTGNKDCNFSAELTAGFEQKAWGNFTKYCADVFLKWCFDTFEFYKIKALIFPDNFRVKTLLKSAGFRYETTLPAETIRQNKLQDIDVYSVTKNYYNKTRKVNYDKN